MAVVDASALIRSSEDDSTTPAAKDARAVLPVLHEKFGLAAPSLIAWEVGNVIHVKFPGSFGTNQEARRRVVRILLRDLRLMACDLESVGRTGAIAETHHLTFYDASYLELALRDEESLLLTEDEKLLSVSRRVLGRARAFDCAGARLRFLDRDPP